MTVLLWTAIICACLLAALTIAENATLRRELRRERVAALEYAKWSKYALERVCADYKSATDRVIAEREHWHAMADYNAAEGLRILELYDPPAAAVLRTQMQGGKRH